MPMAPNTLSIQARSGGRNPELLRLPRQFFRSISLWAMFQSPQMMNSRRRRRIAARVCSKRRMKSYLTSWRTSPEVPEGR